MMIVQNLGKYILKLSAMEYMDGNKQKGLLS